MTAHTSSLIKQPAFFEPCSFLAFSDSTPDVTGSTELESLQAYQLPACTCQGLPFKGFLCSWHSFSPPEITSSVSTKHIISGKCIQKIITHCLSDQCQPEHLFKGMSSARWICFSAWFELLFWHSLGHQLRHYLTHGLWALVQHLIHLQIP